MYAFVDYNYYNNLSMQTVYIPIRIIIAQRERIILRTVLQLLHIIQKYNINTNIKHIHIRQVN